MFLQWKSDLLTFLLVKSLRWKHSWKITKTQNEKCLVYLHIYHIKYIIPNQASSFLTKYVLVQSLTTKLPTPNFPNHSDLSWRYNSTKITWNLFVSVNAKNTQVVPDRKFLTLITIVDLSTCNTQVPSSDVITSLCVYSSVSEAWKVCFYVNGGASAIGDV